MINLVLIEDNSDHALLVSSAIKKAYADEINITHVPGLQKLIKNKTKFDIIISDLNLLDVRGLETISEVIRLFGHATPLIVMTSDDNYELGKKAVTLGAQDYLVKSDLDPIRLRRNIEFAIIRKRYEQKILIERENANKEANVKSILLANMSHELRSPLNGIIGFADYIKMHFSEISDEELRDMLGTVEKLSKVLLSLINDILDFSKLDAGHVELVRRPVNLKMLVDNTLKMMELEFSKKSNDLQFCWSDDLPYYHLIDKKRLRQVLMNLLTNANKFTENGKISVELERKEEMLIIQIGDTGIGMTKDEMEAIFLPYKQLKSARTIEHVGTGLGLPICKHLIEAMGGVISVNSIPKEGTVFTISIPLMITEEKTAKDIDREYTEEDVLQSLNKQLRILCVEDSEDNQKLVGIYLKGLSAHVDYAGDGAVAVDYYIQNDYDIVLMDVQMPVKNGYEAVLEIREYEEKNGLSQVPILALTASTMENEIEMCYKVGCTAYLPKPILKQGLMKAFVELIS